MTGKEDSAQASPAERDGRDAIEALYERIGDHPARVVEELENREVQGSPEQRAAADAVRAVALVRLGEYERGLEVGLEALESLDALRDSISACRATNAVAEALMHFGRLGEASERLGRLAAQAEAVAEFHEGHITLYSNLAATSFYAGSPSGALQPLGRALDLTVLLGDEQRRALILGNFGNLYSQLGDHERALEAHCACVEILRERGERRELANALHNVGVEEDRVGDPDQALRTFDESLALRDTEDSPAKIAKTELDRAFSLVHLERFDEAEEAIERALALHRRTKSRRQEARALTSLGNLEYERRRYREALRRFEESRALLAECGAPDRLSQNEFGIMECHLALGEVTRTLQLLNLADPSGRPRATRAQEVRLCDIWMRALESADQPRAALDFAKRRVELLEELHAEDSGRIVENLQGVQQVELMKQRERDQIRIRAELEALVAERTAQLREANAELESRVDELVRAEFTRSQLEEELRHAQKMDAIGRLAGGVAHDFNNLLTVLLGRGELLQEELPPEHPGQASLRDMMEAASRAARLTVQLLAFGRKQALRPSVLEVEEVLVDLERLLSRLLGERIGVRVERRGEEDGPLYVLADRGQLDQVLINLAINARDAMPEGGRLTLEMERVELAAGTGPRSGGLPAGRYVSIRVQDTGSGMEPDVAERIFEPFFTTKELGKGTGLGLSTVHGIVHQSGGTITVDSEPGRGTTFEVLLPATSAPEPDAGAPPTPTRDPSERRSVLVVEDDDGLRRMIREGLGRRGYEVHEAASGPAALALGAEVDIVICDRVLPRYSGLEVLAELRSTRPNLPFLLISGHAGQDATADAHGVRFLSKPFKLEALTRILEELLEARGADD